MLDCLRSLTSFTAQHNGDDRTIIVVVIPFETLGKDRSILRLKSQVVWNS